MKKLEDILFLTKIFLSFRRAVPLHIDSIPEKPRTCNSEKSDTKKGDVSLCHKALQLKKLQAVIFHLS